MTDFIEPSFEIDDKGRVYCKSHTNYKNHINEKDYFEYMLLETELTCLTCGHYIQDDCYFPRSEIDQIIYDKEDKRYFSCRLCGSKIRIMLTIIQKLYYEKKYKTNIELICCDCHENLKGNRFKEETLNRIFVLLFIFITGLFFLVLASILNILLRFHSFLIYLYFAIWGAFSFFIIRKIEFARRGLKFLKKFSKKGSFYNLS